jgi:hypothetical protein
MRCPTLNQLLPPPPGKTGWPIAGYQARWQALAADQRRYTVTLGVDAPRLDASLGDAEPGLKVKISADWRLMFI